MIFVGGSFEIMLSGVVGDAAILGRNCSHRFDSIFVLAHILNNNHWGRSWEPCVVLGLAHFLFPCFSGVLI